MANANTRADLEARNAKLPKTFRATKAQLKGMTKDKLRTFVRNVERGLTVPAIATKPAPEVVEPTITELNDVFSTAFTFFNEKLFDNRLPTPMILIHRKRGARGYFWNERFKRSDTGETRHEIAMNLDTFTDTKTVLSTFVHEMTHLEQQVFGKPGSNGHHNVAWGLLMDAVDLPPFAIDSEDRPSEENNWKAKKRTGTRVTHDVKPGGVFDVACDELMAKGVSVVWSAGEVSKRETVVAKRKKASKTKFTCTECGQNAWAKPEALIGCWECGEQMETA